MKAYKKLLLKRTSMEGVKTIKYGKQEQETSTQ
jgi:hypothetical protein